MSVEFLYNTSRLVITLPTTEQISDPVIREKVKQALRGLGISDREMPTAVQDAVLYAYLNGYRIVHASGEPYGWPLVDEIWGDERYLRVFNASTHCRYPAKDVLIFLFFQIRYPELAKAFFE